MADRTNGLGGDRPLQDGDKDRLGFGEVAERIATSIVDRASKNGFVLGLDGEWGSGKSSLLHLVTRSLHRRSDTERTSVIEFRPWLLGDRDALLAGLLNDLANAIDRVQLARGHVKGIVIKRAKTTAKVVRKFSRAVGRAGEFADTVSEYWGPLKIFARVANSFAALVGGGKAETDLVSLKSTITKDLKELDHRFIVLVDDVDRLEPSEAVEVLRLVRSVADFPNVIYILCYDVEQLAKAIEIGANVNDGVAYLEKIVQLTVMMPKPEPFGLRDWFAEELAKIVGTIDDYSLNLRLKTVIDKEGGAQLKTPRSVNRALDSVRFFWPAVRSENIDIADLVWLQLIKDGSPKLYKWIESYVADVAAVSFGTASISDGSKENNLNKLTAALPDRLQNDLIYRSMFSELLPGIELSYAEDGPPVELYMEVGSSARQAAIDGRRLASPDHYRLYFSLTGPAHAITQNEFNRFWDVLEVGAEQTGHFLLQLHSVMASNSLQKSDVLLERLRSMDMNNLSVDMARNLLLAFGQIMDEVYRPQTSDVFSRTTWDRAQNLVPMLYAKLTYDVQTMTTRSLFRDGYALGWLTAVLRHEVFAHGRFGGRPKSQDEWLLSEAEFALASELMINRYRSLEMAQILATPRPINVFFAWSQAGDETGPKKLIADSVSTDEGLINVLSAFSTFVYSSDKGRYLVLKKENCEHFIDFEVLLCRLKEIANSGPAELRAGATRLVNAANDAGH